ncbi:MAG TPA: OmpA family protein [Enhygromyxa sp.]|nr:OmpA family protein [Enhygromyxa sp.]
MIKHILTTTLVLSTLALGGCQKDREDDLNQPANIEPPVLPQSEAAREQPGEQAQAAAGTEMIDILVWPAVTVVGVEFECPTIDVHFATDSAELDAADQQSLDEVAACLKGTKQKEQVQITASTDPRGSERYNEQLSHRRAEAVAQYLRQQGVKESSFEIRARGEQGAVEGIPTLWPLQREAVVQPVTP